MRTQESDAESPIRTFVERRLRVGPWWELRSEQVVKLAYLVRYGEFREIFSRVRRIFSNQPIAIGRQDDCATSYQPIRAAPRGYAGPIKLAVWAPRLAQDGAPLSQHSIVCELKRRGIVVPRVYFGESGPLEHKYEEEKIPIVKLCNPVIGVLTRKDYLASLSTMRDAFRSDETELVYSNTLQGFCAVDAARHTGIPSVWNIRESEPWRYCLADFPLFMRERAVACASMANRVIFPARATFELWQEVLRADNSAVIPNAILHRQRGGDEQRSAMVRARRRLSIAPSAIVLLSVGTVCARKGQKDIVDAFAIHAQTSDLPTVLHVVGDRTERYAKDLETYIVSALPREVRSRIVLHDAVADVSPYYDAADVFVFSARIESAPRVILEAMAHGLPIITTPVFGIREQVREHFNALFYEPGDVACLKTLICRLVEDKDLRLALAEGSVRQLASNISFDTMIEMYTAVFSDVADCPKQTLPGSQRWHNACSTRAQNYDVRER